MFTAVTYYTPSYSQVVKDLQVSCRNFDITLVSYPIENQGDWVKNCSMKPQIIRQAMEDLNTRIVWLDADCVVKDYPALFDEIEEDFAAHFREFHPNRKTELLSGTLFFNNTPKARQLLDMWCKAQIPTRWDQHVLADVLPNSKCSVYELPPSYTQIFDSMKHNGKPTIEHFQESRKYRRK